MTDPKDWQLYTTPEEQKILLPLLVQRKQLNQEIGRIARRANRRRRKFIRESPESLKETTHV